MPPPSGLRTPGYRIKYGRLMIFTEDEVMLFRFSLPKEVAGVLQDFCSHQWHLLATLHYDRHVMDVAKANPVLAYAVAGWFADHPSTRRELGRMKQRELLQLLKLPATEALVKLFRKIPPESIDNRLFKSLLSALRTPDGPSSKLLAHVPVINLGVMELVLTPQGRSQPGEKRQRSQ